MDRQGSQPPVSGTGVELGTSYCRVALMGIGGATPTAREDPVVLGGGDGRRAPPAARGRTGGGPPVVASAGGARAADRAEPYG
ncbi:hypothetical protein GCM10010446_24170 [Streptomyces enissocaesilis]|uniref:Uncharacterized protein n=1 Tax=Streptomyces enissocaesilis TaxID=332589 RepID=A0ABN3X515_9ACTN